MKFAWVYIPFFACAGFMAGLLVENPMSLGTMALVTLAITIERLTPEPERMARVIGLVVMAISLPTIFGLIH